GAREDAHVHGYARRPAHDEVVSGVADHRYLLAGEADRSAEAHDHARVWFGAEPCIATRGKVEKTENAVGAQRRFEPCTGIVGGEPKAETPALELRQGVGSTAEERGVLRPAGAEDAVDAGNKPIGGEGSRVERHGPCARV